MVKLTTLSVLADLEQEMARTGRVTEEAALREARQVLAHSGASFLTTGQAAQRLGVSIPTVKRWIEQGILAGGALGRRWLVSAESVEQLVHLRESLVELDQEGNPSPEEIRELYRRSRRNSSASQGVASTDS